MDEFICGGDCFVMYVSYPEPLGMVMALKQNKNTYTSCCTYMNKEI